MNSAAVNEGETVGIMELEDSITDLSEFNFNLVMVVLDESDTVHVATAFFPLLNGEDMMHHEARQVPMTIS